MPNRDEHRKNHDLSKEEILSAVKGSFWKEVLLYGKVDSTNKIASTLSRENDFESGVVIIADMQEKGRGRMGRKWVSPAGLNIYMSLILRPEIAPADSTMLTILTSLACAAAVREETGLDVSIKWPNDILIAGRKAGGILTEIKTRFEKIQTAIVGIGINVNIQARDFPDEIRPLATSLSEEAGRSFSRSALVIRILKGIESRFGSLTFQGRTALIQQWKRLSSTLGKEVSVSTGKEIISGFAEDLDDSGMLILGLASGEVRRISAGDVTLRAASE